MCSLLSALCFAVVWSLCSCCSCGSLYGVMLCHTALCCDAISFNHTILYSNFAEQFTCCPPYPNISQGLFDAMQWTYIRHLHLALAPTLTLTDRELQ